MLNPEHRLGDYSQAVLARLREQGPALMLASGRHYQDVRVFSAQLGGNGCLISSNGAAVHDRLGQLMQSSPLPHDCVRFLLNDAAFDDVHKNVYRVDDWLVERPEPRLLQYHQESGFAYRIVDLKRLDPDSVLKVFFFGDPSRLKVLESMVLERFSDRLTTTFSLPVTLEIMAGGVSKGAALSRVVAQLGIALGEVMAFGDGMNDREMLGLVGKGLIMDNADPRLKQALPHLERIGSNREESVARYLEQWMLDGV